MFNIFDRRKAADWARRIENGQGPQETLGLLSEIKEAAPEALEGDAIYSRILSKIADAAPAAERKPEVARRPVFNLRKIGLVAGLAAALMVTFLGYGISRPPTNDFILKQALAAVDETGKVTYYKVTGYVTYMVGAEEGGKEISTEEYWIDSDRGIVKSSSTLSTGSKPLTKYYISDGKRQLTFEGSTRQYVSESRSPRDIGGSLTDIKAQANNYRRMLTDSRAKITGEETTRGTNAYVVRSEEVPWKDASGRITTTITALIRKDNYEPLSLTLNTEMPGQKAGETQNHTDLFVFDDVKLIDPSTLPPDFFSMDIPAEADYSIVEAYSMDELKTFKDFDVYFLGDSFTGYKLMPPFAMYVKDIRREHVPQVHRDKRHEVSISYNNVSGSDLGITLTIRPVNHPSAALPPIEGAYTTETIDFDGERALLIKAELPESFRKAYHIDYGYSLMIAKGNASVEIYGGARDKVFKAARALRKIN